MPAPFRKSLTVQKRLVTPQKLTSLPKAIARLPLLTSSPKPRMARRKAPPFFPELKTSPVSREVPPLSLADVFAGRLPLKAKARLVRASPKAAVSPPVTEPAEETRSLLKKSEVQRSELPQSATYGEKLMRMTAVTPVNLFAK